MEPPTPLIMRRGTTGNTLWPHCANSPPSQISTVFGSRATWGCSARNTSIGCSLPGVFDASVAQVAGRLVRSVRTSASQRRVAFGGIADQGLAGGARIGDTGEGDAVATLADGAIDECCVGVDDDPTGGGIDRGRLAELQREVERLAEQDDHVGATDRIGEGAERGVVEASRTFDDGSGDVRGVLETREKIAAGGVGKRRAGEHERTPRCRDDTEDRAGGGIVQCDRCGGECTRVRPGDSFGWNRRVEQIGRQAEMHRAGAAGTCDADGFRDVSGERFGGGRCPRGFGHRRGHLGLAQLLESATAELGRFGVTGQQHERRFLALRCHQRRRGVRVARSAGHHGDAGLAGQPAPGVGHVNRSRLMARVDQAVARVDRGVEQRHDVVAGQREDRCVAGAFERPHDDVGAAKCCAAHVSRCPFSWSRQSGPAQWCVPAWQSQQAPPLNPEVDADDVAAMHARLACRSQCRASVSRPARGRAMDQ